MSELPKVFFYRKTLLARKYSLRQIYTEYYRQFGELLPSCPKDGMALELGSGAGFIKTILPEVVTSDIVSHDDVDMVVDATKLRFQEGSLRAIIMINVLHHICDASQFFKDATRCLKSGGKLLIIDQHRGWISTPILKYFHHEPYHADSREWSFSSTGPLSGANGALAWIIFNRDRLSFERDFPQLKILKIVPHTPLRYWLCGGQKSWNFLPKVLYPMAKWIDERLMKISPAFGSFVTIELQRI